MTARGLVVLVALGVFASSEAWAQLEKASPPPAQGKIAAAIRKGVAFLVETQNKDGSWGSDSSGRSWEVLATVPGSHHAFRVASSALCVMALLRAPERSPDVEAATERGLRYVIERCRVKRPNGMEFYNTWTFAYSLQCFAEAIGSERHAALEADMRAAGDRLVEALGIYQTLDGGWTYLDFRVGSYHPSDSSMTFTTATVLIALHEAQEVGIKVPKRLIDRGLLVLRRGRKEDGSYIYGQYLAIRPALGVNQPKGSLGRSQTCNLALHLFGEKVTQGDMKAGLETYFKYHHFADIGRKRPIPHEAWYQTSGYFYFYGHYYGALVLDLLPEADRAALWPKLRDAVAPLQEPDGSWWDYPLYGYHKPYGTAFALLTLIGRGE